jgi:hypothetical protein
MFKKIQTLFSSKNGWVKSVKENGTAASAILLENPKEVERFQNVGGYQGKDVWISILSEINPPTGQTYRANVVCQLSQAMFGMLEAGMQVNVRFDQFDPSHIVLIDDVQTLLKYRLKKKMT